MTATTFSPIATARDGFLRLAMRLDAVLTGIVGIVGLAIAPRLAELSGTTTSSERALGIFFVAYGLAVFALSLLPSVRRAGTWVVVGNVLFTVAAVIVVLAGLWPLTTLGVVLTLGSGVYTLVMADLQYVGLRRMRA
jgi:hypothetical protein